MRECPLSGVKIEIFIFNVFREKKSVRIIEEKGGREGDRESNVGTRKREAWCEI